MNNLESIFKTDSEIPDQFKTPHNIVQKEYLINGKLKTWDGPMNTVLSPVFIKDEKGVTQKVLGTTPLLTEKEALEALDAALKAYDLGHGLWPTTSVAKRIKYVETFLKKMREKRTEVVNLLMWEIGKNIKDSEKEFDRTCDYIVDTINGLKDLDRKSSGFEVEQGIIGQIRRVPLGVALCMGPYNYPLNETFTTLIPALIMGNTVIFKPAKFGVLLVKPLLEAFRDSFPPGVINIIYGRGRDTVGALMASGKIDVLAFIGTNKGANDLKRLHPKPHRLRSVLGLDAKNPGIVFSDADIDIAVDECVAGSLSFNGQRCTALKILFVHKSIVAEFNKKFIAKVNALKAGLPWEEGVLLTPLPEPGKVEYLNGLLEDAHKNGAVVINEGGGQSKETFFFPAILYPVNSKMRVYDEEQFGPVVPIVPFDDEKEAIDYVVNSNFGQQLSIFSNNSKKIGRMVDLFASQVGRININAQCQRGPDTFPFNGRKDSAEGTLSVSDALRVFSIRILVAAKYNDSNKEIINNIVSNGESAFLTRDYIF
jgi:glyceraldehyde-3-phosphate dehydrogenase (NADP+)